MSVKPMEQKSIHHTVSIVVPIRNEERYIDACIRTILAQDYPKELLEVVLVDGCSEDRTVEMVEKYCQQYPFIKLLHNEHKTVQYALNIGIKAATGEYIVRMDAHAQYADDYVSKCIETILKTGADNVGGPMRARGKSPKQKVIAAAYHSTFAMGGGKCHDEDFEGYADTVWAGTFKRQTLLDIGLYDERLPRSEDDDLNFRIIENGGKIYITPAIRSIYYPRSSYWALFKQYYEYGVWKIAVIKKHHRPARITHLIPLCFVLFLVLFGILSFFSQIIMIGYFAVLALYLLSDLYFSFANKHITGFWNHIRLMYVHFLLHISYGLGFIHGIFKFLNYKF